MAMNIILLLLGSGVFAGIALDVVHNGQLARADLFIDYYLKVHTKPSIYDVLQLVSVMGSEFIFAVSLPIVGYLIWQQLWVECSLLVLGVGGGETFNLLLKVLFARQKTPVAVSLATLDTYMFPSGHAMVAFIFYAIIACYIGREARFRRWQSVLRIAATTIVLLIGFSQLVVGGHYLSDVLAGYAAGLIWLVWTLTIVETVYHYQLRRARSAPPSNAESGTGL